MKRLLALLGWIGVVLVLAAVALRFLRPELQPWYRGLALAGLVVTVLYALSQWRDMGRTFNSRGAKYGSIAASSVVLVLGILVGLNWISARQNKRWDLTTNKQFSLSDQTKKLISELDKPALVRVFYAGDGQQYRDRLNEYTYLSKQITVEYIDAERDPLQAQRYAITAVPTVTIDYAGRTEKSTSAEEQALTNAFKKVIVGRAKKVYFVQGHGERDPTASSPDGFSGVGDSLKGDNFDVAKLTLAQEGKVPADATVVMIAGPKIDYLPGELDALRAFLKVGGKLGIFVDPPEKADSPEPTGVLALAKEWGITVGNDIVLDVSGIGRQIGTDASVPIAMPVQHPITDNFRLVTAYPFARSVTPIDGGTSGHVAQKFLETSPQSWAESDLKGLYATGKPERDLTKGDKAGPISIGAAVSAPAPDAPAGTTPDAPKAETRVVVVGDSDFASNRALNIQGNRDIALNIANWLAQQEDLIAIRPKDPDSRPLTMSADQGQLVFWFTLVIVPLLLFGNAVRIWWKKR